MAKDKVSKTWAGGISTLARWLTHMCMDSKRGITCRVCGSGAMRFDDPAKVKRYNALWDTMLLDDVQDLDGEEIQKAMNDSVDDSLLSDSLKRLHASIPVELDAAAIKFFLEDIVVGRARIALPSGVMLLLPLTKKLLDHAEAADIKLDHKRPDNWADKLYDRRILTMNGQELALLQTTFWKAQRCTNTFPTSVGSTIGCPQNLDGPASVFEVQQLISLVEDLGWAEILEEGAKIPEVDTNLAPTEFDINMGAAEFMLAQMVRRLDRVESGPRKLRKVIDQLEAMKGGGGKPEKPKDVAEPATPVAP